MDTASDVVFFLVFFAPIALLVALNLLMQHTPVDVVAPWARLAKPAEPAVQAEAVEVAEVTNDALEREAA
jgi:hypothetical protein